MNWSIPSPRLARTLIVVGMRSHARQCPICRAGANVAREGDKTDGHRTSIIVTSRDGFA